MPLGRGAVSGGAADVFQVYRLVLHATGMRVGKLETLPWGDVGERRERWRVPPSRRRVPDRQVFGGLV